MGCFLCRVWIEFCCIAISIFSGSPRRPSRIQIRICKAVFIRGNMAPFYSVTEYLLLTINLLHIHRLLRLTLRLTLHQRAEDLRHRISHHVYQSNHNTNSVTSHYIHCDIILVPPITITSLALEVWGNCRCGHQRLSPKLSEETQFLVSLRCSRNYIGTYVKEAAGVP